jgi:pyruvate/2-oxoglutarate dehydrogenase complex dihydrolipoamide dehydrogenase (E3) component
MVPTKSRDTNWLNWTLLARTTQRRGSLKVLTPPGEGWILGVAIVGEHAGNYRAAFMLAMKQGLGQKSCDCAMTSHICAAAPVVVGDAIARVDLGIIR